MFTSINHKYIVVLILLVVSFAYFFPKLSRYIHGGSVEEFLSGSPINDLSIGPYSGLYLRNTEAEYWKHPPANLPVFPQALYTPQGTPLALSPTAMNTDPQSNGPTLDGTSSTPKSMFMFAKNQCKPECCPADFSCDGGCICTTENQRNFINTRGGNRTYDDDGF